MQHPSEPIPKVSVVVTAYDRREFVMGALKSVINQKMGRQDFEAILVKNFTDELIDTFAASNGVKLVFSDDVNPGMMCLRGISSSKAEIVSLLDDDDVFHPCKLSIMLEAMSDKAICYIHNGSVAFSTTIPENNSNHIQPERQKKMQLSEIRMLALLRTVKEGGTSNSSSVTFRKGIVAGYERVLEGTAWGPAFTLFCLALLSGGVVCLDERKLTYQRIHDSLSNTAGNPDKRSAVKVRGFSNSVDTLKVMSSACDSTLLRSLLRYEEAEALLRLSLYTDGVTNIIRKGKYASIVSLFSVPIQYRPAFRIALAICSLVWGLLPGNAKLKIIGTAVF